MKVERAIWLSIKDRIETLPFPYAVAYPGQRFEPPHNGVSPLPFIRVGRVSSAPLRTKIADGQQYDRNGFIIVTLVTPLSFEWETENYDQTAGFISDHFNDSVTLSGYNVCVRIPSYPQVSDGYEDNGYWVTPVRIPWRCFA